MAYFNDKMAKKQPLLFIPLIHSHHLHPKTRTEVDFVFEKAYNSKKRSLNLVPMKIQHYPAVCTLPR